MAEKLNFEECGDILFVSNFYDCGFCGNTYRKSTHPNCLACDHESDQEENDCDHCDCPDSRANELLANNAGLLTPEEFKEISKRWTLFQEKTGKPAPSAKGYIRVQMEQTPVLMTVMLKALIDKMNADSAIFEISNLLLTNQDVEDDMVWRFAPPTDGDLRHCELCGYENEDGEEGTEIIYPFFFNGNGIKFPETNAEIRIFSRHQEFVTGEQGFLLYQLQ
jgi:hypothetical protein